MAATKPSPRPPSASPPAGRSSGAPGPLRSATSTRTMPPPAITATVTVSPGSPDRLYRTLLAKISLTSNTATSPHGRPGPSTAPTNSRATRARSARPAGQRHALPNRHPGHRRTRPSPPALPGGPTGAAGLAHGDARSTQRRTSSRNTPPARPVRGRPWKIDGVADRSHRLDAVRYMSVDAATQRFTARHGDTQRDKAKRPA